MSHKDNAEKGPNGVDIAKALTQKNDMDEPDSDIAGKTTLSEEDTQADPEIVMTTSALETESTDQPPDDIIIHHLNIEPGNGLTGELGECLDTISNTDDGSKKIDISDTLPDGLSLFGKNYDSIYVGTNGYITLGHSQTSFTPVGIPGYTKGPMIAAMFEDIFNREGDPGKIYVHKDTEKNIVTVTWKNAKWFKGPALKEEGGISEGNSFQIRLHGMGKGNFAIEIRYANICWGAGDPGGSLPTAGWTAGDKTNYGVVTGSGTADFLNVENYSNIDQAGVFAWLVRGGEITPFDAGIYEHSPGGTIAARLTATDPDTPSSQLTLSIKNDPSGKFEMVKNGDYYDVRLKSGASIDYETTPDHQYVITVQAQDPEGNTFEEEIPIQIFDINETPEIIGEASVTGNEDSAIEGTLTGTDVDNDSLSWEVSQDPANGIVIINNTGEWTYTPNSNFHGSDSFTIKIDDGNGGIATKTIEVNVTAVNDDPVLSGTTQFTTQEDNALGGNLTATDPDHDPLHWSLSQNATNGKVTLNNAGEWTYTPQANFHGKDSFKIQVDDGHGGISEKTIIINISSVNDVPVYSGQDHFIVEPGQLPQGQLPLLDADGESIDWTIKTQGKSGQVTITNNGNWLYSPLPGWSGEDSFIIQGKDEHGATMEKEIHINITPDVPAPILTEEPTKPTHPQGNLPQDRTDGLSTDHLASILTSTVASPPFIGEMDIPQDVPPESPIPERAPRPAPSQNIRVTAQGEILMSTSPAEEFLSVGDMILDQGQLEFHIDYHGETSVSVLYSATLSDGTPLPTWLAIDSTTGVVTGTPPQDIKEIRLHVMATIHGTDSKALDVTIEFEAAKNPPPMAAEGKDPSLPFEPATGSLPLSSQLEAIELPPSGREVAQALMAF